MDVVDDGRWRPILLTIGLLYKLQKIRESGACWYNAPDIFVNDDNHEIELLSVFGFYWHLLLEVSKVLRSSEIDHAAEDFQVRNFENLLRYLYNFFKIRVCSTLTLHSVRLADCQSCFNKG